MPPHSAAKRPRVGDAVDAGSGAAAGGREGPLTLAETALLLRCYEWDIMHACNECGFNRAILATAITFFKRFFLYASPTEYHPAAIACVARGAYYNATSSTASLHPPPTTIMQNDCHLPCHQGGGVPIYRGARFLPHPGGVPCVVAL